MCRSYKQEVQYKRQVLPMPASFNLLLLNLNVILKMAHFISDNKQHYTKNHVSHTSCCNKLYLKGKLYYFKILSLWPNCSRAK